jgi:hypothetical protein
MGKALLVLGRIGLVGPSPFPPSQSCSARAPAAPPHPPSRLSVADGGVIMPGLIPRGNKLSYAVVPDRPNDLLGIRLCLQRRIKKTGNLLLPPHLIVTPLSIRNRGIKRS